MLDFMDEIVERVEELPETMADIVQTVLLAILRGLVILATPIWITPYVIAKQYIEQHKKQ